MTSEQRSRSPRADDLVAYALGEATPSRARRIESRLADDEALRVRLAEIRQVLRLTRELPDPSPSVALRARILAMTREARSADSVTAEPRLRWTEWPAFVAAYLRIRLHTSAGFRTFTVATAVALHVILLTAIAGLTVARLRSEPSSPHISMAPPSASEGETEDLIALDRILPKAEPDIDVQAPRFRDPAEKAPDVVPDALTSEPEIHTVPADLWSEVPGRENRLVLGRWFLFARHRGDRRANRTTAFGGTAATDAAVARALDYLADRQLDDGSFDIAADGGDAHYTVGATSLAMLALLGNGDTPRRGIHRETVNRAIDFLLASQAESGHFGPVRGVGRTYLYNHAFALQALIEAYLMTDRPLARPIRSGLAYAETARNRDGGWRHVPAPVGPSTSDANVTGVMLQALGLAEKAGFETDPRIVRSATGFLAARSADGRVAYREAEPLSDAWTGRTAGAYWALGLGGHLSSDLGASLRERLATKLPAIRPDSLDPLGQLHATLAAFQIGGSVWSEWERSASRSLLDRQAPDGSFSDRGRYAGPGGRLTSTALGALVLETYYRFPRLDVR